jgi:hypothetical protein
VYDAVAEATGHISAQPLRTGRRVTRLRNRTSTSPKEKAREKENGEKGHGRRGQNNATEAEAVTGEDAAGGTGKNGGAGNINVSQVGNA